MRLQLAQLRQERLEVETAVRRRVRRQAADRLRKLPLGANAAPAPSLVPGDGDVDEALEEVALLGRCCAPSVLELLVGREIIAAADQLDASAVRGFQRARA